MDNRLPRASGRCHLSRRAAAGPAAWAGRGRVAVGLRHHPPRARTASADGRVRRPRRGAGPTTILSGYRSSLW